VIVLVGFLLVYRARRRQALQEENNLHNNTSNKKVLEADLPEPMPMPPLPDALAMEVDIRPSKPREVKDINLRLVEDEDVELVRTSAQISLLMPSSPVAGILAASSEPGAPRAPDGYDSVLTPGASGSRIQSL